MGVQQVAFDGGATDGVGPVEDHHLLAAIACGFHAVGQGIDERIDPGARVLEIDQQTIDIIEHLRLWNASGSVKAENRYAEDGVGYVRGFDHVVLFFGKKAMLR
jgi:hypothetical protein